MKPKRKKFNVKSYKKFKAPVRKLLMNCPKLKSGSNKPLELDFETMLDALIYFHLEQFDSGRHLLQSLEQDDFAKEVIAPAGIKKSTFFEAINSRGLEQLQFIFKGLYEQITQSSGFEYERLGQLIAIDGSFIEACFSMYWADYRKNINKAKAHIGFDINRGIPSKFFLSDGKADERHFADKILEPGQTGVMDRYYHRHKSFDLWQQEDKYFVCRIKQNTKKEIISSHELKPESNIFYDKTVLLGQKGINQTDTPVRLVGYEIENVKYWVATNRFDLSAQDVALIYKLRWDIEKFFGWWKGHLNLYPILARSKYGLQVQILAGLITYLLLAIYCQNEYNESVNIKRFRELRIQIKNEASKPFNQKVKSKNKRKRKKKKPAAIF